MASDFDNEEYSCRGCDGDIGTPKRQNGWRCASCGAHVLILATDSGGRSASIERVPASELVVGDHVVMHGAPLSEGREVLRIAAKPNGDLNISLRGYGTLKNKDPADYFNRWTS